MALLFTVSRSNWNLEMLVFVEGGKPKYPENNPRSRDKNQQQTQPTYDAESPGPHWWEASAFTTAPSLLPRAFYILVYFAGCRPLQDNNGK